MTEEIIKPEKVRAIGYCFSNNKLLKENEIGQLFENTENFGVFCELAGSLNGMFNVYMQVKAEWYAFVSPGGFHKLFYRKYPGTFKISASAAELSNGNFSEDGIKEYRSSLFCWGKNTLYRDVYAVPAGYAICLGEEKIDSVKIFSYAVSQTDIFNEPYSLMKENGRKILNEVADRMINYLAGRQAIIPLSGGFDSRFILASLLSRNYKNILAVTYGTNSVPELENASKVASATGTKWHYVEYTKQELNSLLNEFNINDYLDSLVNGNSFPCLHEIIALRFLCNNPDVEKNAVFIPGHSGDFLGGSQYIKAFPPDLQNNEISTQLLKKKFREYPLKKKDQHGISEKLNARIKAEYTGEEIPASIFEDIDMTEKLTKHILNASRAYSYFGFDTYFPFWDQELLLFFKNVPASLKIEKKLYDEILREYYFEPLNIAFEKELNPDAWRLRIQNIKNKIRPYLPVSFKRKLALKNDFYGYHEITGNWRNEMEKACFIGENRDYSYNSLVAQWVIYKLGQVSSSE